MTIAPLGILLLVAGVAICGLGIAGRIRAAQLLGLRKSSFPRKPDKVIYEARRQYELPDHGLYVRNLKRQSNRLIVSGASLCIAGVVLIL